MRTIEEVRASNQKVIDEFDNTVKKCTDKMYFLINRSQKQIEVCSELLNKKSVEK